MSNPEITPLIGDYLVLGFALILLPYFSFPYGRSGRLPEDFDR